LRQGSFAEKRRGVLGFVAFYPDNFSDPFGIPQGDMPLFCRFSKKFLVFSRFLRGVPKILVLRREGASAAAYLSHFFMKNFHRISQSPA
jgi:hypothetical protein